MNYENYAFSGEQKESEKAVTGRMKDILGEIRFGQENDTSELTPEERANHY